MMVLWEHDKQPVNDIARRLMLETNTVTPLLQRMEKQGIVERRRGLTDKRQQIVTLTEKGGAYCPPRREKYSATSSHVLNVSEPNRRRVAMVSPSFVVTR